MTLAITRTLLALSLATTTGCYCSHERATEDASIDTTLFSDASMVEDASSPSDVGMDAAPPPGCRASCAPPTLHALFDLPALPSDSQSYELTHAVSVGEHVIVLSNARFPGYAQPMHRLLYVDTTTGEVRASAPWTGAAPFSVHHRGARIVRADDATTTVLTAVGRARFMGSTPTGTQAVILQRVTWAFDGSIRDDITISRAIEDVPACVGGCEAGSAFDDTHALVTYAPGGALQVVDVPFSTLRAGAWTTLRPVGDGAETPWPHAGVIWEGEHWIAGGGTADLSEPRAAFLYAPDGSTLPLDGTDGDLPPILLSGRSLAVARHVRSTTSSFHVQRLRPGEPLEVIRVSTGPLGALAASLAHDPHDRLVLAWSSLAPGSLRDTVVSVVPDTPFDRCDVVEPTEVARMPQGIVAPTVLAHTHGERLFVMAVSNDVRGRAPQLAVFELSGCRLEE